jgi:hypothetical protein
MHGDFSLNPTAYRDRVSRVLYQMGRVQLDSDANEQTESTLHFLRGLALDLIGGHGGLGAGFRITPDPQNPQVPFRVGWGYYYVDGIRCVNMPGDYWDIAGDPEAQKKAGDGLSILEHGDSFWKKDDQLRAEQLLYLAVWERHVSSAEDDAIREVALQGPDTTSRAVVVWQIRMTPAAPLREAAAKLKDLGYDPLYVALNLQLRSSARMRARAVVPQNTDPCIIAPDARFRGAENRLYRVEIHDDGADSNQVRIKWSPDNASIVYPIRAPIDGTTIKLESLGRDERTAIRKNDWVEVIDDRLALLHLTSELRRVIDVDRHRMTVTLDAPPAPPVGDDPALHPILRRWATDAFAVQENQWTELSDGVEVQFSSVASPKGGYRKGDYWLIPARTATGDLIWPRDGNTQRAVGPHGIDEHYAPLAFSSPSGTAGGFKEARWSFEPLAKPVP